MLVDGRGLIRAMNQFSILSGGEIYHDISPCTDTIEYQWVYKVDGEGERILDTRDLDLRDGRSVVLIFVSYYLFSATFQTIFESDK